MSALIFTQNLDSFKVDVVLEETHNSTLGITDYPVERGTNISDHAQIMPKTFDLSAGQDTLTAGGVDFDKIKADYEALLAVQEKRVPFTVVTALTELKDMLIENFSVVQNKDNATILAFTAHLKQVIIVGTSSVSDGQYRAIAADGSDDEPSLIEQQTENRAAAPVEIEVRPKLTAFSPDDEQQVVDNYLSDLALTVIGEGANVKPSEAVRLLASTPRDAILIGPDND